MIPFPEIQEIPEIPEIWDLSSRSIIWNDKNNGFGTFGWETDHRNSCKFDFHGRIYVKVEHVCLSTYSEF